MAIIEWADKSQTDAYDAAKWNAQDANAVKASVNDLYQSVENFTNSGIGDYLCYKATWTQSGTDAPVATIQFNSLGYVPALGQGTGLSILQLQGTVDVTKIMVIIGNKTYSAKHLATSYYFSGTGDVNLTIRTYDLVAAAYANDMLIDTPIEIRVYN